MNLLKILPLSLFIGTVSLSCVKTGAEACPPEDTYTVRIGVRDKNYGNAREFDPESVRDENLSLKEYVGTLYYEFRRVGTSEMRSARTALTQADREYTLVFDNLVPGRYVLSVWGNTERKEVLHVGEDEGTDVYLGADTLDFAGSSVSGELLLQRAKGKLKIVYKNLPASVVRIRQRIDPVYQRVGEDFAYEGSTAVTKSVPAAASVQMLVAPTPAGQTSRLGIELFTAADGDTPSFVVPDIDRTLSRNAVSLVEVDYHDSDGTWEIWGTVNGRWTQIHDETVEENP